MLFSSDQLSCTKTQMKIKIAGLAGSPDDRSAACASGNRDGGRVNRLPFIGVDFLVEREKNDKIEGN